MRRPVPRRPVRRLHRRLLRRGRRAMLHLLDALAALGSVSVYVLHPPDEDWDGRWSPQPLFSRPLRGPDAGHPERLCHDVPLSADELGLARQLDELADLWSRAGR